MLALEQHSNELKELIDEWIDELLGPDGPTTAVEMGGAMDYVSQVEEHPRYPRASVEGELLFEDLKIHIPELMDKWGHYVGMCDEYLSRKQPLTQETLEAAKEVTALPVYGPGIARDYPAEDVLAFAAVKCLFEDLSQVAVGDRQSWFEGNPSALTVKDSKNLGFKIMYKSVAPLVHCREEETGRDKFVALKRFVEAIWDDATNGKVAPILSLHRDHCQDHRAILEVREELITGLEKCLALAILPNMKCDFIKHSAG